MFGTSSRTQHNLIILQGDPLANPILAKLCQSFYEEEKWQQSLMLQVDGDNEWVSSVPLVMVALAATAVSSRTRVGDMLCSRSTHSIPTCSMSGNLVTLW